MTSSNVVARALIERLELSPHPEGGYYRETYRDTARVMRLAGGGEIPRAASTGIYFLLCDGAYSAWHRIDADEIWHFYAGHPLEIHVIDKGGRLVTHCLGNALENEGTVFQCVVPAGHWFAAELTAAHAEPAPFALVGCTVAPGFEFAAFELAEPVALVAAYPSHAQLIRRLAPRQPPG